MNGWKEGWMDGGWMINESTFQNAQLDLLCCSKSDVFELGHS